MCRAKWKVISSERWRMEKNGSTSSWARRLLIVVLFITILAPVTVTSRAVQAQSPYDEALAELRSIRQQLAELLAIYQSADAETRAQIDAGVARAMQQALKQVYGALSASDRAKVDDELRRMTGYTFPQLFSTASTVPGLVKAVNVLIDALERLAASQETPIATPAKPLATAPTKPPAAPTKPPVTAQIEPLATPTKPPVPAATPTEHTETHQLSFTSGEVYVIRGGISWQPPEKVLGRTNLRSGDEVRTGPNGKAVVGVSSGQRIIQLAPASGFRIWDEGGAIFGLMAGRARVITKKRLEVRTPAAVAAVRGTEFTLNVGNDGATTVTVLQGSVEVRDLASNASVSLEPSQGITIPKVPGGLQQQDMLGRVTAVTPGLIERWWEDLPATSDVSTPIVIDLPFGFMVIDSPSGFMVIDSPFGFTVIDSPFTMVVVVLVIVVVLTFANILWRRRGRRQVPVKETSAEWLEILKTRLAKGEITGEEYEELKNKLKLT